MARQDAVTGALHRRHHAIRADRDDAVDRAERYGGLAELPRAIGIDRLHDIADEARIAGARGGEAGRLVAAPDHDIGGFLDLVLLVAILHALVAGEIEHARALFPQRLADREQDGVAEAAAD